MTLIGTKAHRATQLYELIRHVDRTSNPSSYTIVMGDLNATHRRFLQINDPWQTTVHDLPETTEKCVAWYCAWRRKETRSNFDEFEQNSRLIKWTRINGARLQCNVARNGKHFTCNLRTNSYYQSSMPEQQIDHIMYVPDGRIRCTDASVFLTHPTRSASGVTGPSYSDHAAVMATFEIRPSDQVIVNERKKRRSSVVANESTQKLMIRLNEEIESLNSQQWLYRVSAVICFIFSVGFFVTGVALLRKANDPTELQKRLSIANAPTSTNGTKRFRWIGTLWRVWWCWFRAHFTFSVWFGMWLCSCRRKFMHLKSFNTSGPYGCELCKERRSFKRNIIKMHFIFIVIN